MCNLGGTIHIHIWHGLFLVHKKLNPQYDDRSQCIHTEAIIAEIKRIMQTWLEYNLAIQENFLATFMNLFSYMAPCIIVALMFDQKIGNKH